METSRQGRTSTARLAHARAPVPAVVLVVAIVPPRVGNVINPLQTLPTSPDDATREGTRRRYTRCIVDVVRELPMPLLVDLVNGWASVPRERAAGRPRAS